MQYRPEIDGLRTVAVMPVLLFHAGLGLFGGGYVGVDIFFVISGYLITSIILNDIEKGRFSVVTFYERRARRILPALLLVVVCCIPFAWAWIPPPEFKEFARSVGAVALFVSNVLFWKESGYFATVAEEKPLLHTWSLAVEEQYYVIFPLFLLVMWRAGRRPTFYVICAVAVLSLLYSEWGSRAFRSANFYLAQSRVWELLAGSICAFLLQHRAPYANNMASIAGLAAIGVAVFLFDKTTPFPSLYALLPVGGTALIILFAGSGTWVAQLLSARPMVGIGLISYSTYLWHQPLLAFARIRLPGNPELWVMLGLICISLGLAYLTWRYVEAPFRHHGTRRSKVGPGAIFALSGVGLAACIGFALLGNFTALQPLSPLKSAYLDTAKPSPNRDRCHSTNQRQIAPQDSCIYNDTPAPATTVAVFGDSHAADLPMALAAVVKDQNIAVRQFSYTSCGPAAKAPFEGPKCQAWVDDTLDWIMAQDDITHVVISYRLNAALTDRHEESYPDLPTAHLPDQEAQVLQALRDTLARLASAKQVILLHQAPELPEPVTYTAMRDADAGPALEGAPRAWWQARNKTAYEAFAATPHPGMALVDPANIFCEADRCFAGRDGVAYYFDDDHMSLEGAKLVSRKISAHIFP